VPAVLYYLAYITYFTINILAEIILESSDRLKYFEMASQSEKKRQQLEVTIEFITEQS